MAPELQKMKLEDTTRVQHELLQNAEKRKVFDDKFLGVIVIPTCKGSHAFHKECVLNHFDSMKKDNKNVNFY